jgi:hypothetical protein
MAQEEEHLPIKCEVLNVNPSTAKKLKLKFFFVYKQSHLSVFLF